MKIHWYWLLSLLLIVTGAIVLSGLQTSMWYLVFGAFPPPMMWLTILVYLSVTRPTWEATVMVYVLTFINSAFTVFPFEALLIYSLALMGCLILIRERVFWGGPTFFSVMVGVASLSAPILYWVTSRWFDKNPVFVPQLFDWLISALLTMLFSLPVYRLYQWFDQIATYDRGSEGRIGPR